MDQFKKKKKQAIAYSLRKVRLAFREAMEEASVMMVGLEKTRIMQALKVLESQEKDTLRAVADYSMPNVSDKVLRIILSYTDYINRVVWKKFD